MSSKSVHLKCIDEDIQTHSIHHARFADLIFSEQLYYRHSFMPGQSSELCFFYKSKELCTRNENASVSQSKTLL